MKKIMFNDKYGLTDAVLNGAKTMTRRVIPQKILDKCVVSGEAMLHAPFQDGEIVAIAQRYADIYLPSSGVKRIYNECLDLYEDALAYSQGWNNKMFVRADLMPHHIRITDIKVERLQEISDEDCLKEGIIDSHVGYNRFGFPDKKANHFWYYPTAREAFAALIDKVGQRGTWDSNPWVYVYTFEVVD